MNLPRGSEYFTIHPGSIKPKNRSQLGAHSLNLFSLSQATTPESFHTCYIFVRDELTMPQHGSPSPGQRIPIPLPFPIRNARSGRLPAVPWTPQPVAWRKFVGRPALPNVPDPSSKDRAQRGPGFESPVYFPRGIPAIGGRQSMAPPAW